MFSIMNCSYAHFSYNSIVGHNGGYRRRCIAKTVTHHASRKTKAIHGNRVVMFWINVSFKLFVYFCFFQVTTCFGIAVTTRVYIGYAIVALIIELNSIFLHLRQLFQVLKVPKDSNIYRTNSLICLGKCSLYFWSCYCARIKRIF